MATIIDVAKRAGVSIKTVSRVMNNASNVRQATADRVLEAMSALNYAPSKAARELRSGRSRSIGMLFSDPSSGFQAKLHHGALLACNAEGYFLAAGLIDEQTDGWRNQLADFLRRTRVDSLVLAPPLCDSVELQEELAQHHVTSVVISPSQPVAHSHTVCMDDHKAAREITEHLLGLGHTRLGHLTGPADHVASIQRQAGFIEAINAHPHAYTRQDWIQPGMFRFKDAVVSAERILSCDERPTAIFAANDETAAAVCFAAGRMGLRAPEDLSVVGFDDVPIATTLWPPLTTIAQPFLAMTQEMVRLIADHPKTQSPDWKGETRILGHQLIIRASTAPPRQAR